MSTTEPLDSAPLDGASPRRLGVDVWLDIACPWCVIGELRLERALGALPFAEHVDVRIHSYQLQPDAPERNTMRQPEYLESRGMDMARFRPAQRQLVQMGAELGFHFDQDRAIPSNTMTAHRLVQAAAGTALQRPLVAALFSVYFEQGTDIGDPAVLRAAALAAGMAEETVEAVLADPQLHRDAVTGDIDRAARLGISGVPFLLIDERYGVSGAQPLAAIEKALTTVFDELNPAPPEIALIPLAAEGGGAPGEGGVCGPDGCAL